MNKKTENCYESLLLYIKNNVFNMEPAVLVTDYEQALRNALNKVFPHAKKIGCW